MGTDTTSSSGTEQPLDARRILALTALVDAPTPRVIRIAGTDNGPILSLTLNTMNDAAVWAAWFGVEAREPETHHGAVWFRHQSIRWHGWSVHLNADEDIATQLDADTRAQLEQVAKVTVDDTAGGV